jgi:hypothetical protein
MRIDGLGPVGQPEPKDKKNEKTPRPIEKPLDKVDINQQEGMIGKAGYGESLKNAIIAQVERFENSTQIRRKSTSGYYEESEILKTISDKLIDSKELKDIIKDYQQANKTRAIQSADPSIRLDKVAEVKKKMEEGYYNDPANFDSFAQKLINHFGL